MLDKPVEYRNVAMKYGIFIIISYLIIIVVGVMIIRGAGIKRCLG